MSAHDDVLARDVHADPRAGDEVIVTGNGFNRITVLAVDSDSVTWTRDSNNDSRRTFTSSRQQWKEGRNRHRVDAATFTLVEPRHV